MPSCFFNARSGRVDCIVDCCVVSEDLLAPNNGAYRLGLARAVLPVGPLNAQSPASPLAAVSSALSSAISEEPELRKWMGHDHAEGNRGHSRQEQRSELKDDDICAFTWMSSSLRAWVVKREIK